MSEEPEEDIVSATQTELAFLLVFVFVTLLGFFASKYQDKSGSGEISQGVPRKDGVGAIVLAQRAPPQIEAISTPAMAGVPILSGNLIAAGSLTNGEFGAAKEPSRQTKCSRPQASGNHRFTLLLEGTVGMGGWAPEVKFETCEQRAAKEDEEDKLLLQACNGGGNLASCVAEISAQQQLYFSVGRSQVTDYGRSCLQDLCMNVYDEYWRNRQHYKHIIIEGHTSSEWKQGAICSAAKAGKMKSPEFVGYQCNLALSTARSIAIFEECWGVLSREKGLSLSEYQQVFKPIGRGAVDARKDSMGCEKRRESRRVEFIFIDSTDSNAAIRALVPKDRQLPK